MYNSKERNILVFWNSKKTYLNLDTLTDAILSNKYQFNLAIEGEANNLPLPQLSANFFLKSKKDCIDLKRSVSYNFNSSIEDKSEIGQNK